MPVRDALPREGSDFRLRTTDNGGAIVPDLHWLPLRDAHSENTSPGAVVNRTVAVAQGMSGPALRTYGLAARDRLRDAPRSVGGDGASPATRSRSGTSVQRYDAVHF